MAATATKATGIASSSSLPLTGKREFGQRFRYSLAPASIFSKYVNSSNSPTKFIGILVNLSQKRKLCAAFPVSASAFSSISMNGDQDGDSIPTPIVLIDNDSDPNATIVEISFGDRLGKLLDTMKALKELGLDVSKGSVSTDASVIRTKLFITSLFTGRKVEDPEKLERIRLTVLNNILKYHPESSERLALGEAFGVKAPEKKVLEEEKHSNIYVLNVLRVLIDLDVATHIHIKEDGPQRSLLCIETADRPGLLIEIMKILEDVNVSVVSAEIDTEGLVAKDKFHVSYRGSSLNSSLSQVLINCLRYYLRRPSTDEESY